MSRCLRGGATVLVTRFMQRAVQLGLSPGEVALLHMISILISLIVITTVSIATIAVIIAIIAIPNYFNCLLLLSRRSAIAGCLVPARGIIVAASVRPWASDPPSGRWRGWLRRSFWVAVKELRLSCCIAETLLIYYRYPLG